MNEPWMKTLEGFCTFSHTDGQHHQISWTVTVDERPEGFRDEITKLLCLKKGRIAALTLIMDEDTIYWFRNAYWEQRPSLFDFGKHRTARKFCRMLIELYNHHDVKEGEL